MASRGKKTYRRRRLVRSKKFSRKMRGGDGFSETDKTDLKLLGFTDEDIQLLNKQNITDISPIKEALKMTNTTTGNLITPAELMATLRSTLDSISKMSQPSMSQPSMSQPDIPAGGKKRRRQRHTRKQKGGTCYGSGVGANSFNPNFSIYNTNALKLFPYRPE
jgi:hypothetical protein